MIRDQVKKDFLPVLEKLKIPESKLEFEHPQDFSHGDYSTNLALRVKKPEFANPFDLANKIVNTWRSLGLPDWLGKIEVAPPGFINLWLKKELLVSQLSEVLKQEDRFGELTIGKGKTVVVDYSSPNIAKPFGIGHLRSTIIGQALYNLYQFLGFKVIGDNHLGDWGTQFGKIIVSIKLWSKKPVSRLTIEELEKLYVKFHKEAEVNSKLEDEARSWFKKLEEGDLEARKIWKACVDLSLKEFERIYKLLGVKIGYAYGESFYQDKMGGVISDAKKKGIAEESQGALIIPLSHFSTPALLLKSDEGTTYLLRDLATIKYREKRWKPSLVIYEVGVDQKFYFQQLFATTKLLGYGPKTDFVHVAHGLIRWEQGKFSTRRGETIHLEDILNEAIERAEKIIKDSETSRGLTRKEQKEVAQKVGIGAILYFDLSHEPTTDIIFDWEKIFVLEGNSGPYLQYTYARCQSVLAKSKRVKEFTPRVHSEEQESKRKETEERAFGTPEELAILRTLYRFPEVVEEAAKTYSPNLLCNFLFDLAQKYNLFYNKLPILHPEKEFVSSSAYNKHQILKSAKEIREGRLALTAAVAQILKNGLVLLGIRVLERM